MAVIPNGPWRAAFDEAWASWCGGNFGIGAVLVNPEDQSIVTRGRNRVEEKPTELRQLAGNLTAHAEMNAYAALERRNAKGLVLYTTLEPCPMCDATGLMLRPDEVHFAALDPYVENAHELWSHQEWTASRAPARIGPLEGLVALFAEFLPMTYMIRRFDGDPFIDKVRAMRPDLSSLADEVIASRTLAQIRDSYGDVEDAVAAAAPFLATLR
ncbi:MAG: deaminase [Actinomycetota bacterium]